MDSNVVNFPGRKDGEIDARHAEAFRDMESSISDCVTMGQIAAECMSRADNGDQQLAFSVFHLRDMPAALRKEY
jgi:hypothetical protein